MKLLVFYLLCLALPLPLQEPTIVYVLKMHMRIFRELKHHTLFLDDSILSSSKILTFPINEQSDTIYVEFVGPQGGTSSQMNIWNNDNKGLYAYNEKVFHVQYDSNVYRGLVASWEPELLVKIGEMNNPLNEHAYVYRYLSRIIIDNGKIRMDTVSFRPLYLLDNLTNSQLDSIRAVVKKESLARQVHADSLAKLSESIGVINDSTASGKSDIQHQPSSPKTLWQRIVDWFRNLWHSIFG